MRLWAGRLAQLRVVLSLIVALELSLGACSALRLGLRLQMIDPIIAAPITVAVDTTAGTIMEATITPAGTTVLIEDVVSDISRN